QARAKAQTILAVQRHALRHWRCPIFLQIAVALQVYGHALREVVTHQCQQIIYQLEAFRERPVPEFPGSRLKILRVENAKAISSLKAAQAPLEKLPLAGGTKKASHD